VTTIKERTTISPRVAQQPQRGAVDGFRDGPARGRPRLKALTVVDNFTMESVDIALDHGMSSYYVVRVLVDIARFGGKPTAIPTDQGPEFTARALDQWPIVNVNPKIPS